MWLPLGIQAFFPPLSRCWIVRVRVRPHVAPHHRRRPLRRSWLRVHVSPMGLSVRCRNNGSPGDDHSIGCLVSCPTTPRYTPRAGRARLIPLQVAPTEMEDQLPSAFLLLCPTPAKAARVASSTGRWERMHAHSTLPGFTLKVVSPRVVAFFLAAGPSATESYATLLDTIRWHPGASLRRL